MSLVLALCLDALFGAPNALWNRLPHPAVLMGRAVGWIDKKVNKGGARRLRGTLAFALLCGAALALGFALQAVPGALDDVILAAILFAHK